LNKRCLPQVPWIMQFTTFNLDNHIPRLNIHLNSQAKVREHYLLVQCVITFL
jgi:hypothetical protein